MKFGSWTFDGYRVDVVKEADEGDTKKYVSSGEWDLIGIPAQRNEIIYACCPQPYPDVTYTIHIRRRTIYYYINMIVPCALITCKPTNIVVYLGISWRRGGLLVSALDSASRGLGPRPGLVMYCVLGKNTLLRQRLSPPRSINGYQEIAREAW